MTTILTPHQRARSIIREIAALHCVDPDDICTYIFEKDVSNARAHAVHEIRKRLPSIAYENIGEVIGRSERTVRKLETRWHKRRRAKALPAPTPTPDEAIGSDAILSRVAMQHGVSVEQIKSSQRVRHVAYARHHAAYEIRRLRPHLSLPTIGRLLGGNDHTTILYAIRIWPKRAKALGIPVQPLKEQA